MREEVYRETFRSPAHQTCKADAEYVLNEIRKAHPATFGWEELNAYVEEVPGEGWRAVREHVQYRNV